MFTFTAIVVSIIAVYRLFFGSNSTWQQLRAEAKLVKTCGHMPPPPIPRGHRFMRRLSRWLLNWQVGPVRVIGAENLVALNGPRLFAPNHYHFVDPFVLPNLLEKPARYMMDNTVFTYLFGMVGVVLARCGVFAVDISRRGSGAPARQVAVEIMASHQTLVVFPEGYCSVNGDSKPFRKGVVRITRETAARTGEVSYLVPTYFHYGVYAEKWLVKLSPPLQYLFMFLTAPILFRRGLTVVFGQPIPHTALPQCDEEATRFLQAKVLALKPTPEAVDKAQKLTVPIAL